MGRCLTRFVNHPLRFGGMINPRCLTQFVNRPPGRWGRSSREWVGVSQGWSMTHWGGGLSGRHAAGTLSRLKDIKLFIIQQATNDT